MANDISTHANFSCDQGMERNINHYTGFCSNNSNFEIQMARQDCRLVNE